MPKRMTTQELLDTFDEALREHHIFVCYQPKMNHATGRMIGAEALLRWNHPEFGMQFPSDFIPVLEEHDPIYRADLHNLKIFSKITLSFLKKVVLIK